MKLLTKFIIMFLLSFMYAECLDIDNQEECDRVEGCEWSENAGCIEGEWEDDGDEEEFEGCSDIDNQEDCERMEGCEWSENAGCIEGEWEDDEDGEDDEWEDECRYFENEYECLEAGCSWGEEGCFKSDEDDEEQLSCEELNYQLECEATDQCEWVNDACQSKDDSGGALDNSSDIEYNLLKNYPNPFNPSTTINFSVSDASQVSLKVYNVSGKEVSSLVNGFYSAGNYSIQWDAKDSFGNNLSSGIYIYKLNTNQGILSNTMMLIR